MNNRYLFKAKRKIGKSCQKKNIKKVNKLSEQNRTPEEYVGLFAHDHCNDDNEVAAGQAIVKEVVATLKREWLQRVDVLEYLRMRRG